MKFNKGALASLLLLLASCGGGGWHGIDAFVPSVLPHHHPHAAETILSCFSHADLLCPRRSSHQYGYSHLRSKLMANERNDDRDEDDDDDDDEDDEDDAFSKGVNSVAWLPSVTDARSNTAAASAATAPSSSSSELIPLFPLGGIVYTPNSEHILNIFEQRYRDMYTDILMNGTKRFAVAMSHPTEAGCFAQMAVLFELDDLKEVSEQTSDQIKYICNHKVTGRVKLHRILNPEVWESRDTYLRAEGTVIDDSGKAIASLEEDNATEQELLQKIFGDMVDLQFELEEDVRFTRASVLSLAVKPGSGVDGLWQTIKLWQSFAEQRLMARQNELQGDFQEKLKEFLEKEKGLNGKEMPRTIAFQDLSIELQKEVVDLQKRIRVELQPLVIESTLTMQKVLECLDHTARLQLVRSVIETEIRRLLTKKTIQDMFTSKSSSSSSSTGSDKETSKLESSRADKDEKTYGSSPTTTSSIVLDDDAFQ